MHIDINFYDFCDYFYQAEIFGSPVLANKNQVIPNKNQVLPNKNQVKANKK